MMTRNDAIKLINEVRCSNSFTMGLSTEEYIKTFKLRWRLMYNEELETEEDVAIAILKIK